MNKEYENDENDNEEIIIVKRKDGEEIVLTERRIRELTSKFIELCADEASVHDDFGMNCKVTELLIDLKKVWWPSTQKNLNVNVDAFDSKLKTWMDARKEMQKAQEEGLTVFEIQK